MDWLDEVRIKLKKRNQVLFVKDAEYLQDLTMLFREQSHKTIVLWALDLAAGPVARMAGGRILCSNNAFQTGDDSR